MKDFCNFFIICFLASTVRAFLSRYTSCDFKFTGGPNWNYGDKYCTRRGVILNPAPIGPPFYSPPGNTSSGVIDSSGNARCDQACFDTPRCLARSFTLGSDNPYQCQLYRKTLKSMNFVAYTSGGDGETIENMDRRCWDVKPGQCAAGSIFEGFNEGISSSGFRGFQDPNTTVHHYGSGKPAHCGKKEVGLRVNPMFNQSVVIERNFTLKIGRTYNMTYDMMYEKTAPERIFLARTIQRDAPGIETVFSAVVANEAFYAGRFRNYTISFTAQNTTRYAIKFSFEPLQGVNTTSNTNWWLDNFCLSY